MKKFYSIKDFQKQIIYLFKKKNDQKYKKNIKIIMF